jgi:hypothetical protein
MNYDEKEFFSPININDIDVLGDHCSGRLVIISRA